MIAHPHPPHEAPHSFVQLLAQLALIASLVFCVGLSSVVEAATPPASFYVESTGHALHDPFLRFWIEHNGEHTLGLPVTDVVELDGRTAQYFQYGVLVLKTNREISRLKAGKDLLAELQADPTVVGGRRAPSARTVQGIRESDSERQTYQTGTLPAPEVHADLRPYWEQWGGEELLGAPITEPYWHHHSRTQWFEFGRIDLGPGGAILAEVGLELARHAGVPTAPGDRGNLPLFDPARFGKFAGDGTLPNAAAPFDPVRLQIPRIKVDAAIEITTVQDGVMTNPADPWKAGWYQSFSRPGEWTNTVIAGHRDWWDVGPVVFWNLGYLQPGDKIYLSGAAGTGATYVVGTVEVVPRTVDPQTIINDIGYEALTLITCGGSWTGTEYTDRIIIRAYRI